jgi:hypothetical protein
MNYSRSPRKIPLPRGLQIRFKRYKEYDASVLVAITKNWPEVPHGELRKIDVKSFRWQDICRGLRQPQCRSQADKFLCNSFATYLEATDMAYREDISRQDLES